MILNVPYIKQQTDYVCGPAALYMLLQYHGVEENIENLIHLCSSRNQYGTTRKVMSKMLRSYGLQCKQYTNGTLQDVEKYIEQKIPVLVNYREPEANDRHYALVVGFEPKSIVLNDPYHGPQFTLSHDDFEKRWYGWHRKTHNRWLLVASPEKPSV